MPWHTTRTRVAELAAALGECERRRGQGRPATSSCWPRPRSARCARAATGPRRLLGDAPQAQPGGGDLGAGRRPPGARPGGQPAGRHGARARARGGRLARRVGRRCASCCAPPARPPRGCATASSTSRSTPSGCARTSTTRCWPSASPAAIGGRDAARARARGARRRARWPTSRREHLSEDEAGRVLDPATYLGATDQLIDRALERPRPSLMTHHRRPLRDRRARRRRRRSCSPTRSAARPRCGTPRSPRSPSACAWSATTIAATAARPSRRRPTSWPTSAPTPCACSTV